MIVADRFVLLHLHKSGGSFANELVLRFAQGAREIGYHLPRSMIPADWRNLPVLGFVRNPWSYYVSWFSFQSARPQPNLLFQVLSNDGTLGFEPTIRNMLELADRDDLLEMLTRGLPNDYGNRGLNLPGHALAPIRGTGLGFYSFLYRHMYAGAGPEPRIGRMESLRDELVTMMEQVGECPSQEFVQAVRAGPARNVSSHATPASYYSKALGDLVARRDGALIEQYGYRCG